MGATKIQTVCCVGAGVDAKMCKYKKMRNVWVRNQQSGQGKNWRLDPLLSFMAGPGSPNPFTLLIPLLSSPLSGFHFHSVIFFLSVCSCPYLCRPRLTSPKLPSASDSLPLPKLRRARIRYVDVRHTVPGLAKQNFEIGMSHRYES